MNLNPFEWLFTINERDDDIRFWIADFGFRISARPGATALIEYQPIRMQIKNQGGTQRQIKTVWARDSRFEVAVALNREFARVI